MSPTFDLHPRHDHSPASARLRARLHLFAIAALLFATVGCGSGDGGGGGGGDASSVDASDAAGEHGGDALAADGVEADAGAPDTGPEDGASAADAKQAPIELVGEWKDPFGTVETITATAWDAVGKGFSSKSAIVWHDNAKNVAITQSSPDDPYTANKFSRRVWTEPDADGFAYCTVVFGLESLDLALASTATADDKDLGGKGCGGFPWSKMTKI